MVKLINIVIKDGKVCMDCLPEGNHQNTFYMEIEILTGEIVYLSIDRISIYARQALWKILEYLESQKELPSELCSWWC